MLGFVPIDDAAFLDLVAHEHVLSDAELRDKSKFLVNDDDAGFFRVANVRESNFVAFVENVARVSAVRVHARQHFHQGRLASTILATDRVDLSVAYLEVDVIKCDDTREDLRDVAHLQDDALTTCVGHWFSAELLTDRCLMGSHHRWCISMTHSVHCAEDKKALSTRTVTKPLYWLHNINSMTARYLSSAKTQGFRQITVMSFVRHTLSFHHQRGHLRALGHRKLGGGLSSTAQRQFNQARRFRLPPSP